MGTVIVAGSANVDTSVLVREHPRPGETVLGSSLGYGAGGKGLNQAIAASRAGATTRFAGAVGSDAAAEIIREALKSSATLASLSVSTEFTGSAFVMVSPSGENAIVVMPGANGDSEALSVAARTVLDSAGPTDVVLAQLEIPVDVVTDAVRSARGSGAITVLNAAPSRLLPRELLEHLSILVVNEHECLQIAALPDADVTTAALALAEHVDTVVATLGEAGALVAHGRSVSRHSAYVVSAVDTTAAGDTFCGAMCAELASGASLADAIDFGMAAAALAVQRHGAVSSIPGREEVLELMSARRTA